MEELAVAENRWRTALAAWAIPDDILARAETSPWTPPRELFTRRADQMVREPGGRSFALAREALDPPGTVLDVGCGAGAASLPLASRAASVTGVDSDPDILGAFGERGRQLGVPVHSVTGRWPDVAGQVEPADVVVCHHVAYNVPDIVDFLGELTRHARCRVVVELTARHPLVHLNPLWLRFHGLRRPETPTAADLAEILTLLGLQPYTHSWNRPGAERDPAELVELTRRRLCLPASRAAEVAAALRETDIGGTGSELVTMCWAGRVPDP